MNNVNLGQIFQVVGLGLGVIASLLLITRHPILIGLEVLGAALYFVGKYINKN